MLGVIDETNYGVVPDVDPSYGGTMGTLSDKSAWQTEDIVECGSRVMSRMIVGYSTGFSATFRARRSTGNTCIHNWLIRALGGETPSDELGSFSVIAKTGPQDHHIWTGSVIDTLTLSQSAPASAIQVQVDAISRWHGVSEQGSAFYGPTEVSVTHSKRTVPTPTTPPENRVILSIDEVDVDQYKSWTLTISNALQSDAGAEGQLSLSAGEGSIPTGCEVTLDVTFTSTVSAQTSNLRNAAHLMDIGIAGGNRGARIVIGGETQIILEDCILDATEPDRNAEGPYDETIRLRAGSIRVV